MTTKAHNGAMARWSAPRLVSGLIGLMAVVAVSFHAGLIARPSVPGPAPVELSWWLLALAFAATGIYGAHLTVRSETHTVTLTEVPLVVGLALASPGSLIAGRLVGSAFALIVHRRLPPVKVAFNLALAYLETTVAIVVYRAVLGSASPVEPRGWVAAGAAVVAVQVIGTSAVRGVLRMVAGPQTRPWTPVVVSTVAALLSGVVGLTAVVLLWTDARLLAVAVVLLAVGLVALRSVIAWLARAEAMKRVSGLATELGHLSRNDLLRASVVNSRDLLRAQAAEAVIAGEDGQGEIIRLTPGGDIVVEDYNPRTEGLSTIAATANGGAAAYARDRGYDDGLVIPIPGHDGPVGLLAVFNREGPRRRFDRADTDLLHAIAACTGLALK